MFEELDDPAPDLRPGQTLPSVRARGRRLRRRRRVMTATGAGTAVALVTAVVLALPGGVSSESLIATDPVPVATPTATATASPAPSAPPSATPLPSPSPTRTQIAPTASATTRRPSATPSAVRSSPAPSRVPTRPSTPAASRPVPPSPSAEPSSEPAGGGTVELRGDDLGVTAVGAARKEAVAALTAALGTPESDPARGVDCVTAEAEVEWSRFRVGFDSSGRLSGWASTGPGLTTPSGVGVGTTVARLQQVYGDRLQLSASDSEAGDTYTVEGVDMLGSLSGTGRSDRVVALRNGSCTGP